MKVAAVQHDIVWEDRAANFARLAPLIARRPPTGARLVVLTEMFATGFSMAHRAHRRAVRRAERGVPRRAGARRTACGCAGRCPSAAPATTARRTRSCSPGPTARVHRYGKIHPFTLRAASTSATTPATERVTVDVEGVRAAACSSATTCASPTSSGRSRRDTDCYVVVANWPAARREHWRTLLRARAIENQAYVVGVNRVGRGRPARLRGRQRDRSTRSARSLADGDGPAETILVADVDPAVVREIRAAYPFLPDRRQ